MKLFIKNNGDEIFRLIFKKDIESKRCKHVVSILFMSPCISLFL